MKHNFLKSAPVAEPLATVILAHGAGAPMDSDFMNTLSELLSQRGCEVIRFEFPYMAERRITGSKRPPNTTGILLEAWREVVALQRDLLPAERKLIIGGKSMGGRMASMVADELPVAGLVCLGYPFHPPRKPENLRVEHLQNIQTPTLIIQGTRDALGSQQEVADYSLSTAIQIHWLPDGDHDFKPRVKSGFTQAQHLIEAADRIMDLIQSPIIKRIV